MRANRRIIAAILVAIMPACSNFSFAAPPPAIGAIPGSFDVSLSGSSNYSIPIKIAPGSGGTQPQIQLNYDSQNLGGPLGAGWALGGISAITRGPRDQFVDGEPGAVNLDDNDALYLDGQRIVPVSSPTVVGGIRELKYRKVNDDFTEIVQLGPDLNHSYFRARTKGGVTLTFGNPEVITTGPAPNTDATATFANGAVAAFAESAAIDTAGNFIAFHYILNTNGDHNISEIDYTGHAHFVNNAKLTIDRNPFASLTFQYKPASRPIDLNVGGQLLRKDEQLTDIYACVSAEVVTVPFSCSSILANKVERTQVSHYKFDYKDTKTASRFLLTAVHMYGSDDSVEISPTLFSYTPANPGWDNDPTLLPSGLVLAEAPRLGAAFRFIHFAPDTVGAVDLLFAAQINGQNVAYAFKNNGPGAWTTGSQPWAPASKSAADPNAGAVPYDFAPPIPFVDASGGDLGVIVADITGTGRAALIQSSVSGRQPPSTSAYLAGQSSFEEHAEYRVPFIVSRDGKVVANYRFGHWTGGSGPDLIYESEGHSGFLKNDGVGVGWTPDAPHAPPVPLDAATHLVDLDCSGGPPSIIGVGPDAAGNPWKVYRFGSNGWDPETRPEFQPPFPPSTNPEAIREIRFASSSSTCAGLIVATAENGGLHKAFLPTSGGWAELTAKAPPFDLVDAQGNPSKAFIADLRGDGFQGVFAHTALPGGGAVKFAFIQDASGWRPASFDPRVDVATDDPNSRPINAYAGPLVGQGGDNLVVLNNVDETPKVFRNDGTNFVEQTDFAPPIPFARQDKKDLGVRFVDLHGTGLPDVIFSRLVTTNGKTTLQSGAYRNTGHGWVNEPGPCTINDYDISNQNPPLQGGLCPPVPFAGDDITDNPIQFVDLDGDGYPDLIYSYKNKVGNTVTKIYFNIDDGTGSGGRKWSDASVDPQKMTRYMPPPAVFPLSSFGIGDMGVRFTKFDANRLGVLVGFRAVNKTCVRFLGCFPTPGAITRRAFAFDGTQWLDESGQYAPPIPFVSQYDFNSASSATLFVQIIDVSGSGLPSIVANYSDFLTAIPGKSPQRINKVWINTGHGWDGNNSIQVPWPLDAVYQNPKTSVQVVDVNGDGLPDIVMTKGDCPSCSKTWLGTGKGWVEASNWQVPAYAIANNDGDPGFRLVDTKGDGYLDVLWMRPNKTDGTPDRGLVFNDGNGWTNRADALVPAGLSFVDKDGIDQGVRLLSVTGKGLTDIVASFAGRLQHLELNRSRRADVLESVTDGYGLKTNVYYQTLLELDGSDPNSGVKSNPLSSRAYERDTIDAFPKVAPVPTTYVVRQASVDEGNGYPVVIDYRYGRYRMDALAARSLGFGWRESLNEFSNVLTRSDMVQDARSRSGVSREATCIVDKDVLKNMINDEKAHPEDSNKKFPLNLCQEDHIFYRWGSKIAENNTCWTVVEGDVNRQTNDIHLPEGSTCGSNVPRPLSGFVIRQSLIASTRNVTYELDGRVVSAGTNSFVYDATGSVLERRGDVLSTSNVLDDGSSIETTNEYSDDAARWFLGRLKKSKVAKLINDPGSPQKTETRCSSFGYDESTGMLASQVVNCDNPKAVTTQFKRDPFGNVIEKSVLVSGEPVQTTKSEFDPFGRYEVASINVLGHRSETSRDPGTGQPKSVTDANGVKTIFEYDPFGRLRKQTSPTGVVTSTDLIDARLTGALPSIDATRDISSGLSVAVRYAIKTEIGSLPPSWTLFDIKGRELRQVSRGFTADPSATRYIFSETKYDVLGRVLAKSLPHDASDTARWMENEYDQMGRVCASTAINGLRTETIFVGVDGGGGRVIVVLDPKQQLMGPPRKRETSPTLSCGHPFPASSYRANALNQETRSRVNMRKELIEAKDAKGKVTYTYDAGGRLERMTGPIGAVTANTYDELGEKISVSDPDLGFWQYQYDAFGRVVRQIDAKGQISTMEYDVAGRPTRRALGDVSTTWNYDTASHGLGKVASITNSNGYKKEFYYDLYGRTIGDAVQIDQDQFISTNAFDEYGRVTNVTYPNAFAVQNVYDRNGFFVAVTNRASGQYYWQVEDIDPFGRVTNERFGNGVKTVTKYNTSNESLQHLGVTAKDGERALDLNLNYDLIGNLKTRTEAIGRKKEAFNYDEINRLIAFVSAGGGRSEYHYDAAGRISYKAGVGDYHYAGRMGVNDVVFGNPFHAVASTNYGRFEQHYKYDLNGNLISSPEGHFEYTSDNHLKLLYLDEQKWARFDYGPSGGRFRQFSRIGTASEETIYFGLFEEVIEYSLSANSDILFPDKYSGFQRLTRSRAYLVNGSGVFGVVETDDTLANTQLYIPRNDPRSHWYGRLSTTETWYMHADQLGSILCVTDQDGLVRERFWYDPWGKRTNKENDRPGRGESQQLSDSWKRGFTGHEHLEAFSLIHMNGRVYSTILSQFLSVDPVNQMVADTQSGNGYSYARNNPLRYTDPSGNNIFGDIGHALGDAWHGITHLGGEIGKWIGQNWRVLVVVAVVIVVSVLTVGAATPEAIAAGTEVLSTGEAVLIGAEAGAAAGAAGGFVGAALYGGTLDEDIQAAIKGGVIGAFSGAAFAGVGSEFTPPAGQQLTTTSQVEWVAAHGVVGGAKSLTEGGNFWTGFIAAAATKATSFGGSFGNFAADTSRAAVVGGTVAVLTGDKFENGAITGAFSYTFNDGLHGAQQEIDNDRIEPDYPEGAVFALVSGVGALYEGGAALLESIFAEEAAPLADEAFHYTFSEYVSSIQTNGLRAESYASDIGELTPLQAQMDLALPPNRGLPDTILRIDLNGLRGAGYEVPEFTQAGRMFNMPGGGMEMQFQYSVPPEFISVVK